MIAIRAALMLALLLGYGGNPEHEGAPVPTDAAMTWLSVLGDGRAHALSAFTAFPFTYAEGWRNKRCAQTVPQAELLGPWVDCVHEREPGFVTALHLARRDFKRVTLSPGLSGASKRLRAVAGGAGRRGAVVSGSIQGEQATFYFVVALTGRAATGHRVVALYVDSSTEAP